MRPNNTIHTASWRLVALLAIAACSPVQVTTSVAPDSNLRGYRTFRVMNVPQRRAAAAALENDPMLDNSISNRALRGALENGFSSRGYAIDTSNPDFTVAYYASRRGRLDVTAFDYGYPGRWGGWRGREEVVVQPYTEGTVIVDVVDARTHELAWRGRGESTVSDDPATYAKNLNQTVTEIVKRFPARVALSN